jgi:hypothetical protein
MFLPEKLVLIVQLQFVVKALRDGISSAGCCLVDYYYTQKHKLQAGSPSWQPPSIPIDGSGGPKSHPGMFDGQVLIFLTETRSYYTDVFLLKIDRTVLMFSTETRSYCSVVSY